VRIRNRTESAKIRWKSSEKCDSDNKARAVKLYISIIKMCSVLSAQILFRIGTKLSDEAVIYSFRSRPAFPDMVEFVLAILACIAALGLY